jgi:hypothetical protein
MTGCTLHPTLHDSCTRISFSSFLVIVRWYGGPQYFHRALQFPNRSYVFSYSFKAEALDAVSVVTVGETARVTSSIDEKTIRSC